MHAKWLKYVHWPEYGAEFLETAFLVFAGLSAVVFDFGKGLPPAQLLPDAGLRRLITGLLFSIRFPMQDSGRKSQPSIALSG
ncbi:MAG TPA: hypothetical protein VH593_13820 [Ktedonobacteraceae bacterium]|jgi:aquaporin Z